MALTFACRDCANPPNCTADPDRPAVVGQRSDAANFGIQRFTGIDSRRANSPERHIDVMRLQRPCVQRTNTLGAYNKPIYFTLCSVR